ncbi:MAG TPA: 2-dehydropantoate 2-reductase [Micromonosporaceae bacterium]|jgi:2-dehydropantoate 2-reductase|nr:2-dehydropantoate 2-reductase [Micromonosporaceae bacterium]
MKIAIYGAGGVGGYFGALLARAGHEVHFVARGTHLASIRKHGLRIRSVRGDFSVDAPATEHPADIGECDVVLFCVKAYDTVEAGRALPPLLGEDTAVISVQNGVDNEQQLADVIGERYVVGGASFVFSTIGEPGVIVHSGGPDRLSFGELDGVRTARVEAFRTACQEAGFDAEVPVDIRVVLWSKFAFICALAGMTAAVRRPLGDIRSCPESWVMFQRVLDEVTAIGRAEGVPLPDGLVDSTMRASAALDPAAFSSLHHDLTTGRRMELEALHGSAVRRARALLVPAPTCEAIYSILRPWAVAADIRYAEADGR